MTLAPRPPRNSPPDGTPAKGGKPRSKSSVASAEGKARQRARNGGKTGTNSGSSGAALAIKELPRKTWEEIEDEVHHVCDIAGKISHSQVGASGYLVSTLNSPLEYAHDLLDAHLRCRDGLVYIRIYHVPLEGYLGKQAASSDTDAALDAMEEWLDG